MSRHTTRLYAPPDAFAGHRVVLPEEEARHAVRVLRYRAGDEVHVVDGAGGWYRVHLDEVNRHRVGGRVLEHRRDVGEPGYELTLGMALLKQPARFETVLEKATECGVRSVVPLLTARTEKKSLKQARAHQVLVAAMKQCGRSRLVTLADPTPLEAFLDACEEEAGFLCHEAAAPEDGLLPVLLRRPDIRSLAVLVGPEGGFTDDEVASAGAAGFRVVSLGPRRLRAETAGMVATAAVMLACSSQIAAS